MHREYLGSTSYFWSPKKGIVVKSLHQVTAERDAELLVVERKILERLGSHPGIVHYLGFHDSPPKGICLAEVNSGTLQDYIGRLNSQATRNSLCTQLLKAVEFIHKQGVIHSDLRPENCLLHQTETALELSVCDFGGSTCQDLNLDGRSVPDPPFWNLEWTSTVNTDIFATGSIIYTIMKAAWPFKEDGGDTESRSDYEDRVITLMQRGTFPDTQTIAGGKVIAACWTEQQTAKEILMLWDECFPFQYLNIPVRTIEVHLKLSDFGLSKQLDDLKTFCGTALYLAPEVFCAHLANGNIPEDTVKYDSLVDIWSLAVVLAKLECGELPKYLKRYASSGRTQGDKMVEFVHQYRTHHGTNDLLSFVIEDMLVVDPEKRQPTRKCHEKALRLFAGATSDDTEDSGEEHDPSTPRALPGDVNSLLDDSAASEESTIRPCLRAGEVNSQSSELSKSRAPPLRSVSLIVGLAENGSGLIDDLLNMSPSDISAFERWDAPTLDTVQHNSVVGSEPWDAGATTGARGSVAGLEESES